MNMASTHGPFSVLKCPVRIYLRIRDKEYETRKSSSIHGYLQNTHSNYFKGSRKRRLKLYYDGYGNVSKKKNNNNKNYGCGSNNDSDNNSNSSDDSNEDGNTIITTITDENDDGILVVIVIMMIMITIMTILIMIYIMATMMMMILMVIDKIKYMPIIILLYRLYQKCKMYKDISNDADKDIEV